MSVRGGGAGEVRARGAALAREVRDGDVAVAVAGAECAGGLGELRLRSETAKTAPRGARRGLGCRSVSATESERLRCAECRRKPRDDENAADEWRAYAVDDDELHTFWECAEREFG